MMYSVSSLSASFSANPLTTATHNAPSGGYDYKFLDDTEKYACPICTKVLRDARLTECCGQHYCDSCLKEWLQRNRTCPHCRKAGFQSILNKEKIREISELQIYCPNRKKRCRWAGTLGDLKDHQQSDNGCSYEKVQCSKTGYLLVNGWWQEQKCEKQMERRFMAQHEDHKCSYRDYTCEHCGCIDTYDAIVGTGKVMKEKRIAFGVSVHATHPPGNHYDRCTHIPLECPNKCGKREIKRKYMEAHLEVCPRQPLDCPYKDAGCTYKAPRKDMESHIQNSMEEHLLIVFKSHQELKVAHQELKARLSNAPSGGYDYKFLDDTEKYECPICTKVLRDARLTECCGQHYCDSCLKEWLKRNRTCPHCRKAGFQSILNKEKIREINELLIRCTNRKKRCRWVGSLGDLTDHQQSDNGCDYEEVQCPKNGYVLVNGWWREVECRLKMERRFMAQHTDCECLYRDYTCQYCGSVDTYDAIAGTASIMKRQPFGRIYGPKYIASNHYATCDHFPLECPNKCGERKIKRKDMEFHLEVCPLQPLDCPYKDAGCTHITPRKDMESHIENSTQEHLLIVFQSLQELKARVRQ